MLSYRVRDAVVAYDDVLDIGWTVWGSQWDFDLDHLTASFTNPALDPTTPCTGSGATRATSRAHDGARRGQGDARARRRQQQHRGRVPGDDAPRPGPARTRRARQVQGDGLPKILAEEQALDDDFNSLWNRIKRFIADHALLLALAIAAARVRCSWSCSTCLARERDVGVPEYLPEPPDDATPALAYGLAHEGGDSTTRCSRRCSTWSTAATTRRARRRPTTRSSTWRWQKPTAERPPRADRLRAGRARRSSTSCSTASRSR